MFVKVVVLGRPGSGKSTAIHRIIELADRRNYHTAHIRDYTILFDMFKQDVSHKKFKAIDWNGFDVLEFSVLDDALKQLEKKVEEREQELDRSSPNQKKIIMIEFARNDYSQALSNFTPEFLSNAYFLYIEAGLKPCIDRIHRRRANNNSSNCDRHFVSDDIMNTYYQTDNWLSTLQTLSAQQQENACRLNNDGLQKAFELQVSHFAQAIFDKEFSDNPTPPVVDNQVKEMAISLPH